MDSPAKETGEVRSAPSQTEPSRDEKHMTQSDLFDDVIVKIKFEANGHAEQYEQLRRVLRWGSSQPEKPRPPPLTIMYYMGRPIESFDHAELVVIAREGWALYHSQLESSIRSMRLMSDLHKASRR